MSKTLSCHFSEKMFEGCKIEDVWRCLKVVRDPTKVDSQRKKMNFSA